jgi:hypothetical protein
MTSPLPRSSLAAEGVSAAGLTAFLDAAEAAPGIALHSLMVLRHGRVVAEGWAAPHRPTDARQLYSLSKSFTATALGLEGHATAALLTRLAFAHAPGESSARSPVVRHDLVR